MSDAMVTARMSAEKKEEGARILEQLGTTASQIINQLYDCLIETHANPFEKKSQPPEDCVPGFSFTYQQLEEARAWVDSFPYVEIDEKWRNMPDKAIKFYRLKDKGFFEDVETYEELLERG